MDGLAIRDDLRAAREETVARWGRAGTWWTGAERLAIVTEVRRALDAAEAPPAWVRASEIGTGADSVLPAAAVDAVWRLTNHSGTMTQDWCEQVFAGFGDGAAAISPLQYVELVGLVAQANCVDRFSDALSIDRPELPEPTVGEPSGVTPEGTAVHRHWVPTESAGGAAVLKALSAVPAENDVMYLLSEAHYLPIAEIGDLESDRNSLTRPQVEVVAARTSKLNECFY